VSLVVTQNVKVLVLVGGGNYQCDFVVHGRTPIQDIEGQDPYEVCTHCHSVDGRLKEVPFSLAMFSGYLETYTRG